MDTEKRAIAIEKAALGSEARDGRNGVCMSFVM